MALALILTLPKLAVLPKAPLTKIAAFAPVAFIAKLRAEPSLLMTPFVVKLAFSSVAVKAVFAPNVMAPANI